MVFEPSCDVGYSLRRGGIGGANATPEGGVEDGFTLPPEKSYIGRFRALGSVNGVMN